MGEVDLDLVVVEQLRPQLRDLLSLGQRVRGDETHGCVACAGVLARLEEPCSRVIQSALAFLQIRDAFDLRSLLGCLLLRTDERRVADDIGALVCGQQRPPFGFECVRMGDRG